MGAAKKVLAVWDAKSDGVTAKVPPSVRLPEVVTVPVRVNPLTVPVPETEVTEPPPVPAPMAVRNVGASIVVIVLSALIWTNVIALGLVSVKKLPPTVVAPSDVRPVAATKSVAPPSHFNRSVYAVSHSVCFAVVGMA